MRRSIFPITKEELTEIDNLSKLKAVYKPVVSKDTESIKVIDQEIQVHEENKAKAEMIKE